EREERVKLHVDQRRQHPAQNPIRIAVCFFRRSAQIPERISEQHTEERKSPHDVERGDALARRNRLERSLCVLKGQIMVWHIVSISLIGRDSLVEHAVDPASGRVRLSIYLQE